jgi:hypothetical protein
VFKELFRMKNVLIVRLCLASQPDCKSAVL